MNDISAMPDDSRLWVYQANRLLSEAEVEIVVDEVRHFLKTWTAHGADLEAALSMYGGRYILIAVNEQQVHASGCSIDKSVKLMEGLGKRLGIDFFSRMIVGYIENEQLMQVPLHQFWAMRKAGIINDHTLVVNTLVKNVGEWKTDWIQPFIASWHQEMWSK